MSIGHWTLDTAADVVSGHIAIGETYQYIIIILNVFLVEPFEQKDVAAAYSSCFPTILIYLGFLGLLLIKEKGS